MLNLIQEVNELSDKLEQELIICKRGGCELAEAEREYRVILRKEILEARAQGAPVTIINDICRGKPDIADARMRRDCAEAIYKSSQEAINVYKLKIRLLNDQINREWHSGDITQGGYL